MTITVPKNEELRAWQCAVCEWLGIDIHAAVGVRDNLGTLARPKPDTEPLEFRIECLMDEGLPTPPTRGRFLGWDYQGDGETSTATAKVALGWNDERELLAAVGPKPSFMDLKTELMLRGLGSGS